MLRSHFLIALRNLTKQRFYSAINIFGLTVGLTAALLIGLYIQHELSYDTFHQKADRMVKANLSYGENEQSAKQVEVSPDILLSVFQQEFPEIVGGVRVYDPSRFRSSTVKLRDELFEERGFMYADSTFFNVFSFPLIEGNPDKVLEGPGKVVLTKSTAMKYFPLHDPVGAQIEINGRLFQITGIMEDPPVNSSLAPTMVASFSTHPGSRRNTWGSANYYTYLLLEEDANLPVLQAKVQPLMQRLELSIPEQVRYINFELIPLKHLHLYSAVDSSSSITFVLIFSAIALLILVIAIINYMNLATAKSTSRAKEVGVRKSIGAYRGQLIAQFLVEASLLAMLAAALAAILAIALLPYFNVLTGVQFGMDAIFNTRVMAALGALSVFIGLLAGLYPSLVLSMFKPTDVLKGNFKSSGAGNFLRKGLVVFQFGVSVFLIVCTLVVGNQLRHVQSITLGYDRENVVIIPINNTMMERSESFKNEIISRTAATQVSIAGESPASIQGGYSLWAEGMPEDASIGVTAVAVDNDYVTTLKMEMVAGAHITAGDRLLLEEDQYRFVVNEKALEELQIPLEEAVGKRLRMNGREGVIKGVIKDFHFRPLHQKISPLVLFPEVRWAYNYAMVRLSDSSPEAMDHLRRVWIEQAPDTPFSFDFLDDTYNRMYHSETRLGQIFAVFSTLGIIIASLGLLGLVSFAAVQRAKEIGIRKVLGASVPNVMGMMTKDFGKLLVLAFILAAPMAYLTMDHWLQSFEYRVSVGALPMALAFMISISIAALSIGYQVVRAAISDPVDVLKDE